jgi:hypothetical protein
VPFLHQRAFDARARDFQIIGLRNKVLHIKL